MMIKTRVEVPVDIGGSTELFTRANVDVQVSFKKHLQHCNDYLMNTLRSEVGSENIVSFSKKLGREYSLESITIFLEGDQLIERLSFCSDNPFVRDVFKTEEFVVTDKVPPSLLEEAILVGKLLSLYKDGNGNCS